MNKKLIEVALPLDKINAESAREKSIRHGHPSTLHLWWARRPLAAARAVIWSSLVDDPSSHPELFPTEEAQNAERKRLFKILEDLVIWENSNNEEVLKAAKNEILRSTNGNPPALLDPFAGGGAIPLEAQRLGLEAYAHDLNPVAVMINKAMIEIPFKFANMPPINQNDRVSSTDDTWKGTQGLAADIKYYGEWIKRQAFNRIGHMYPKVKLSGAQGEGEATVITWIWARTVKCPNPACKCEIPMASSFVLSKKKGNEAWAEPIIKEGRQTFIIHHGKCPKEKETAKKGRSATFTCFNCGTVTTPEYVRLEASKGHMKQLLMAIVAEGKSGRIYLPPNIIQEQAASVPMPDNYPSGLLGEDKRAISPPAYGLERFENLFTNRQLNMLSTFSDLVKEAIKKIEIDATKSGMIDDHIPICSNGNGSKAYGEAVGVYLSFVVDKLADYHSSVCSWHNSGEKMRNTFGRQAIPMVWDFAEGNPFSSSSGCFDNMLEWVIKSVSMLPATTESIVDQADAQSDCGIRNVMISTDPPYYDNIGYADLSDYFYIWMRRCLKDIYPDIFRTMLVPKVEELVAIPYRHENSREKARSFFEEGMLSTCKQIFQYTRDDIPVSIYYAYKQSELDLDDKSIVTSSGWETMLNAIISAGFSITGTWPVRTELANRNRGIGSNALATSVVITCRRRIKDAPQTTRRNLINILRKELRPALKKLQESNIAPVDLAQSAIGPGMAVYSRYRRVLEADGSPMSVRSALQVINEEIDLYFNEQIGDMDPMSRFCIDLYIQSAFNDIKFGDADILARAKGTSVSAIATHNAVYAKAGIVHLLERTELPESIDKDESCIWLLTQQLTQAMATGGVEACAKAVYTLFGSNAERAKDLAYRLYTVAEQKKWASEAYAYNALVVAWPDIQTRAAMLERETPTQIDLFEAGLIE